MATVTKMVDDLDGSDAAQTIKFSVHGANYTMDLSDENAAEFFEKLNKYIHAATPVVAPEKPAKPTRGTPRAKSTSNFPAGYLDEVRAWGKANGHDVADRGRIKASVLEAYRTAQHEEAEDKSVESSVVSRITAGGESDS